jgi:ornithine cyclodeaminase/alanine dehydrogenase-like protein (mu-crystallin family)
VNALILGRDAVASLLPMDECLPLMEGALRSLARGEALQPLRQVLRPPGASGALASMPAALSNPRVWGVKALSIFPGNHGAVASHQGAVLLFDATDGRLLSIQDAGAITAVRTAAVSAVATRALAREDAGDLAILGAGVQAAAHLEAMRLVRRIRRVRVWGRNAGHAAELAQRMSDEKGVAIEVARTAREAVDGADLICTCTAAQEPIIFGPWLAQGAHVNLVGSSTPGARELDASGIARGRLFVDSRTSALAEAGDFLRARDEGAVTDGHIAAELGEVLIGAAEGRRSSAEITLFKSVGLAVEDVAAAWHAYQKSTASP